MVEIRLINVDRNIAYFHCLPEFKENEAFDLEIDLEKEEIRSCSASAKLNVYVAHAVWKIYDLFEITGNIPERTSSVWV